MTPEDPTCIATTRSGRPCTYRATSGAYCSNHDPAQEVRRRAAGRVRHPRFTQRVGDAVFDRAKVPTVAQIVDRLLDLEQLLVECGDVDEAKVVDVRRKLLVDARDTLWGEREHVLKVSEAERKAGGAAAVPGHPGASRDLGDALS